jgi:hypothetical protein
MCGANPRNCCEVARAAMHPLIGSPNIPMAYFLPTEKWPHGHGEAEPADILSSAPPTARAPRSHSAAER